MSTFKVPVIEIEVTKHKKADRLEIAKATTMDYSMIVPKGQYKTGDIVVYIPEQSIVPDAILEELGLVGKLAGSKHNRVKAMKLRGIVSQGLVYPNKTNAELGTDMAELLGIVKYEEPIPIGMAGEVCNIGTENTIKFDVDNIKNHPSVFSEEDDVEITEKIHGTFMMVGGFPDGGYTHPEIMSGGQAFAASKGLGGRGLVFKDNEQNINNVYIRATKKCNLDQIVVELANDRGCEVILMGEVFGKGVQDLAYGGNPNEINFRLFGGVSINQGLKRDLSRSELNDIAKKYNLEQAPILYTGKFSKEIVEKLTDGKEMVSGNESHIREGVVVCDADPTKRDPEIGRKLLKSISFAYLNREDGTEYN
jgi:RNA ligase (TIGR02306 family)